MNKIKFSHYYLKLNNVDISKPVKLLEVFDSNPRIFSDSFREYDTKYMEENQLKFYNLQNGKCIVLVFQDENGIIFTTVRMAYPETKRDYYIGKRGEMFEIVFTDGAQS